MSGIYMDCRPRHSFCVFLCRRWAGAVLWPPTLFLPLSYPVILILILVPFFVLRMRVVFLLFQRGPYSSSTIPEQVGVVVILLLHTTWILGIVFSRTRLLGAGFTARRCGRQGG